MPPPRGRPARRRGPGLRVVRRSLRRGRVLRRPLSRHRRSPGDGGAGTRRDRLRGARQPGRRRAHGAAAACRRGSGPRGGDRSRAVVPRPRVGPPRARPDGRCPRGGRAGLHGVRRGPVRPDADRPRDQRSGALRGEARAARLAAGGHARRRALAPRPVRRAAHARSRSWSWTASSSRITSRRCSSTRGRTRSRATSRSWSRSLVACAAPAGAPGTPSRRITRSRGISSRRPTRPWRCSSSSREPHRRATWISTSTRGWRTSSVTCSSRWSSTRSSRPRPGCSTWATSHAACTTSSCAGIPHVFGDVEADSASAVVANWEQIKKAERSSSSLVDSISPGLPSLLYAHKLYRKAASVGLEPDPQRDGFDVMRDALGAPRRERRSRGGGGRAGRTARRRGRGGAGAWGRRRELAPRVVGTVPRPIRAHGDRSRPSVGWTSRATDAAGSERLWEDAADEGKGP